MKGEVVGGVTSPSHAIMDKQPFIELINKLNKDLDNLGLYVVDCNLYISNADPPYESMEELRREIINKKATLYIDIEALIGDKAWQKTKPKTIEDVGVEITSFIDFIEQNKKK